MKTCFSFASFLSLSFFLMVLLPAVSPAQAGQSQPGILLTVNQTGDSNDTVPGDGACADAAGLCSLRAAVQEANAHPGADFINFNLSSSPPSFITLTLGEVVIADSLSIVGTGARYLTVIRSTAAGTPEFRIFDINGPPGTTVVIRDLKIRKGVAPNGLQGGGLYIAPGNSAELTNVAVSENSASSGGGGIANAGTISVTHSLVNRNTVDYLVNSGGGLINLETASKAVISDSTFTDNAAKRGAGIYNNGTVSLANATFAFNQSTLAADSFFNNTGGTVYAVNTLFGPNPGGLEKGLAGAFNSLGNNIVIDPADSTGFTNGIKNDQVGTRSEISVMLGALSSNGGQTDTLPLFAGSAAINRGSNCVKTLNCGFPDGQTVPLYSDQRPGYGRYVGGVPDIGAFEYNASGFSFPPGGGGSTALFRITGLGRSLALVTGTLAVTNAKQYSVSRPFGNVRVNGIFIGYVYIIEVKSKRAGTSGIFILPLDDPPTFALKQGEAQLRISNYELRISENK